MSYKIALLTECFITHITGIRALASMYALMCSQRTPINESLITNCTGISALTTMYALMCYQTAPLTEPLITHKYKCAHHYVCVDVLSHCPFD
jgi:hypothetical protein